MGEILDNLKAAASGTPYTGSGISNTQTGGNTTPIMGSPDILRHSLDSNPLVSNPIMSNPMNLNENGPTIPDANNSDSE